MFTFLHDVLNAFFHVIEVDKQSTRLLNQTDTYNENYLNIVYCTSGLYPRNMWRKN